MRKEELIRSLESRKFPKNIVDSFKEVNRESFISKEQRSLAYHDKPLPIGEGQTISQPYTIAFMLTILELKDNQKILEVGSGSGYVLALMNEISKNSEIFGMEIKEQLAEKSRKVLKDKENIKIINRSGDKGLKEESPFDRIIVSASSEDIPQKLVNQLKVGGIMVVPVKNSILKIKRTRLENKIEEFPSFVFVPLVSKDSD